MAAGRIIPACRQGPSRCLSRDSSRSDRDTDPDPFGFLNGVSAGGAGYVVGATTDPPCIPRGSRVPQPRGHRPGQGGLLPQSVAPTPHLRTSGLISRYARADRSPQTRSGLIPSGLSSKVATAPVASAYSGTDLWPPA